MLSESCFGVGIRLPHLGQIVGVLSPSPTDEPMQAQTSSVPVIMLLLQDFSLPRGLEILPPFFALTHDGRFTYTSADLKEVRGAGAVWRIHPTPGE